jgi:hypothetical protein
MRSLGFVACLVSFVVGCSGRVTGPSTVLAPGVWGGDGILMAVTAQGATIDYGCDTGTIDEPVVFDQSGRFSARGSYSFGRGGPIEPGEPPARVHPARYDGTASGKRVQLTVVLPELTRRVGDFTLELGGEPLLDRCL